MQMSFTSILHQVLLKWLEVDLRNMVSKWFSWYVETECDLCAPASIKLLIQYWNRKYDFCPLWSAIVWNNSNALHLIVVSYQP